MQTQHRTYQPKFEGRTRDAIVTSMVGNVVGVSFKKKGKRPALKTTAVLISKGRVH